MKNFFPRKIEEKDSIQKTLEEIFQNRFKMQGWQKDNQRQVFDLKLKSVDKQEGLFQIHPLSDSLNLYESLKKESSVFIFFCSTKDFLFKARMFLEKDDSFLVPEQAIFLEKRRHFRLQVSSLDNTFIKFEINKNGQKGFFQEGCYDISESGLSIIVSGSKRRFFEEEMMLENVVLTLGKQAKKVNLCVKNIISKTDIKGICSISQGTYKVGLEMVRPNSDVVDLIKGFIFLKLADKSA